MFMKIKIILITGLLQPGILSSGTQVVGKQVEGRKLQNLIETAVEKEQHPQVIVVREYFSRTKTLPPRSSEDQRNGLAKIWRIRGQLQQKMLLKFA